MKKAPWIDRRFAFDTPLRLPARSGGDKASRDPPSPESFSLAPQRGENTLQGSDDRGRHALEPRGGPLNPVALIIKKRDGAELSADEIRALVRGFLSGEVADYQMSAWLMAALLEVVSDAETVALTDAMLHSGKVLALSSVSLPKIDKHSTGGVGDKISLRARA